jgi:hypothetical protein
MAKMTTITVNGRLSAAETKRIRSRLDLKVTASETASIWRSQEAQAG